MKGAVSILVVLTPLAGCVSTGPVALDKERTRTWSGKTLAVTSRPRPDFIAMNAGKAAFGVVGALATVSAGNEIVKENGIEDPAPVLEQSLFTEARTRYSVVAATNARVHVDTTDIGKMARAASGADLLLDVQSGSYLRYFPTNWNHYFVTSGYHVALIDVRSASVIATADCGQTTKDDPSPPTKDELLADKASRLKAILATQREACSQQLEKGVLGIT